MLNSILNLLTGFLTLGAFHCPFEINSSLERVQLDSGRSYLYYKPSSYDPSQGMILYLHGGASNALEAAQSESDYLWQCLAERVGVMMVFPEGLPIEGQLASRTWNPCDDVDYKQCPECLPAEDDVLFMRHVVDDVKDKFPSIALERVYATGISYGANMAMRLGLEASDVFAAIGSIAGNLPVGNDNGNTAYECSGYTAPYEGLKMPVFLWKGDQDPRLQYGGPTPEEPGVPVADHSTYCQISDPDSFGQKGRPRPPCLLGALHSNYDTLAFWLWKNGLSPSNQTVPDANSVANYIDTVNNCTPSSRSVILADCDGSDVTRYNYGSGSNQVVFLRSRGGGHIFPGPQPQPLEPQAAFDYHGWKNRDPLGQDAPYLANEMWEFFKQFSRH